MLHRMFPRQIDNRFAGHRSALWLLGLLVALKLVMSLNSILNTASVAEGADGFALASFGPSGARAVLMLFAVAALGQLALALIALAALIRWRSLVPFLYLVSLCEQIGRRLIVASYAVDRTAGGAIGWYLNAAIVGAFALGLLLSLLPSRAASGRAQD